MCIILYDWFLNQLIEENRRNIHSLSFIITFTDTLFFFVYRFGLLSSVTSCQPEKNFPHISYNADLLAVNSLFYLSGDVFNSFSFLKDGFTGYKSLG